MKRSIITPRGLRFLIATITACLVLPQSASAGRWSLFGRKTKPGRPVCRPYDHPTYGYHATRWRRPAEFNQFSGPAFPPPLIHGSLPAGIHEVAPMQGDSVQRAIRDAVHPKESVKPQPVFVQPVPPAGPDKPATSEPTEAETKEPVGVPSARRLPFGTGARQTSYRAGTSIRFAPTIRLSSGRQTQPKQLKTVAPRPALPKVRPANYGQ